MYTLVDLFAGCGGGSMGFHQAGFTTQAAVEIDENAAAAYALNVGLQPLVTDIRNVTLKDLRKSGVKPGELTLLFGCPPCQSFTILRRGSETTPEDEKRNTLIFEYLRLVETLRPRHIAFENVPGLVEGRWQQHFDVFRDRLAALGFRLVWSVIDAADYGVPQRRRRVLVIGSRVTEPRLPEITHGPGEGLKPYVTVRDTISHLRHLQANEADPSDPLHRARRHSALALQRLACVPEGGGRIDLPDDLVLTCHRDHDGHYDIYGRMWWDRVAPTLTSGCTNITRGRFAHPEQDRAITLREAALLQTFPPGARLSGGVEAMALQVGNAVPSLLAQRIGETIISMERDDEKTPGFVPSSPTVSSAMSRHPRRDTGPEMAVRRRLHAAGLRYRVNLPVTGMQRRTIDIAFPGTKIAVFIDGCFWHGCAAHRTIPKSNNKTWTEKIARNQARDTETTEHLTHLGWLVLRYWEHEKPDDLITDILSHHQERQRAV